ncbi:hypothetical protein RintRC_5634 [Richelia intracellularis]|nr:hypothetical protein RintRC_5634 [Richelia intracellularis]
MTTLFGTLIANRIGYGGRKINTLFPLDGEFNLPAQQYSHGLRLFLKNKLPAKAVE